MPQEIRDWVTGCSPKVVIDGTFGAGGHARLIASQLPDDGLVIGLDRDPAVLDREESSPDHPKISVFLGSYEQSGKALQASEMEAADAMVLDLGLSSDQLADRNRGF